MKGIVILLNVLKPRTNTQRSLEADFDPSEFDPTEPDLLRHGGAAWYVNTHRARQIESAI